MRCARDAWSLVEILVVIALLLILAIWLLPKYTSGTKPSGQPHQTPKNAALAVQCRNNLQQIRLSIRMSRPTGEEPLPASLQDLRLPAEMLYCPVSKQPYWYDPQTGRVQCPTPSHEGF
jgi:hypothetical protein